MLKKNRVKKVRKHVFYKHTNIVTKEWGEKTREIIFPETHEYREEKRSKNIVLKKCDYTFFFINTRIS